MLNRGSEAKGNLVFQGIKDQKGLPDHSMSVKSIATLEIYQRVPLMPVNNLNKISCQH